MPGTLQGSSTLALHVIPWSKLDVRERGMGKCWLSAQPSREKGAEGSSGISAACMHGLLDKRGIARHAHRRRTCAAWLDMCSIAGAWPHLVALPETSLEGSLSSPGAWSEGRRPSRDLGTFPSRDDGKSCPGLSKMRAPGLEGVCRAGGSTVPAPGCAGKKLFLMGTGLSLRRWLFRPVEEAGGPRRWHPSPSKAAPSYLTSAEVLSRAASLRSRASTAPPSRCTHTSCGSLSTLRISSWCLPMHAATSCGKRVGHASHLGPHLASPGLRPEG